MREIPDDVQVVADQIVWGDMAMGDLKTAICEAILAERQRCANIARATWEHHKEVGKRWQKNNVGYSAKLVAKAHAKAMSAWYIAKAIEQPQFVFTIDRDISPERLDDYKRELNKLVGHDAEWVVERGLNWTTFTAPRPTSTGAA